MRSGLLLSALLLTAIRTVSAAEALAPTYDLRWVYCMHNLQVKENADALVRIIERAGKAGYNGVVLADYKVNILDRVPEWYFKNVERVREAAAKANVELIPAVFPIGYSSGLLAHDPNLAEGLPVRDQPFVIQGRQAVLASDPPVRYRNGGLEEADEKNRFSGFSFQDDPGQKTFVDREIFHGGKASCRMQSTSGNCRLVQKVAVRPHTPYRFRAWVKTRDLQPTGGFKLMALGGKDGRGLTFHEGTLQTTQDWQEIAVVFNSLAEKEVLLYAGQWGGKSGTLWIDDLALEEVALVNVLRRPGCPFTVTSAVGSITYEEGKDYEPVRDDGLGVHPWAGAYDFQHPGAVLRRTETSRIRDGERLRVSWYHPVLIHGEQMTCCLGEPKVNDLLRDQARRVHKLLAPKTYFMSHDEIRVAGWCEACRGKKTPGEMLADNVKHCAAMLREVNPLARIVVWSDMFDPHHNAVEKYYLVNGPWTESWRGLTKDVIIANWNGDKMNDSLKFFADRGHSQLIAGYYDGDLAGFHKWQAAARGVPGICGFMYTTWSNRYEQLEEYGRLLKPK